MKRICACIGVAIIASFAGASAVAQESDKGVGSQAENLAEQLANPLAALISVPFQLNDDQDIGTGDEDRNDVNATFLQPFLSYTTPSALTFTLQTESTYDWATDHWSIPINALVTKVIKVGDQVVSTPAFGSDAETPLDIRVSRVPNARS